MGVLFFVFIKGVFSPGEEGWERSVGLRWSRLQGFMVELGLSALVGERKG